MTERQIEWMQEQLFEESGPFYQLSTKPLENDLIFTEDEERKFAINQIRCDSVNELHFPQRKELALELKNKWGASNKQIARIARLEQRTVNELFPLSAK